MGSDKVDWAINGELALNCNCTVFCPCAVSLGDHPPTEGYCQTWLAVRIDNGHFNDVDTAICWHPATFLYKMASAPSYTFGFFSMEF